MDISTDGSAGFVLILFVGTFAKLNQYLSPKRKTGAQRNCLNRFVQGANQIASNQSIVHSAGFSRLK